MRRELFRHELFNRRGRRSRRPEPQIPIAPLIDIVFLLLIFFMLVTKFISPSIAIALPESDSGAIDESPARLVSIDAEGNTYLDDMPASPGEITSLLIEDRESGRIKTVRLRADRHTAFQSIVDVLNAIRDAGITDIAIETGPENPPGDGQVD